MNISELWSRGHEEAFSRRCGVRQAPGRIPPPTRPGLPAPRAACAGPSGFTRGSCEAGAIPRSVPRLVRAPLVPVCGRSTRAKPLSWDAGPAAQGSSSPAQADVGRRVGTPRTRGQGKPASRSSEEAGLWCDAFLRVGGGKGSVAREVGAL